MYGDEDVGEQVGSCAQDGNSTLTEVEVDTVEDQSGRGIANDRGEEDKGDDGVGKAVIFFELQKTLDVEWG